MRDEAHRFSLAHHRKRRSAAALHSALDDIPGIGPATRQKLMDAFGTVEAIKTAKEDALLKIVSLKVSQAIRQWALRIRCLMGVAKRGVFKEVRIRKRMQKRNQV